MSTEKKCSEIMKTLLEVIPSPMLLISKELTITKSNEYISLLSGYSNEELNGMKLNDLFDDKVIDTDMVTNLGKEIQINKEYPIRLEIKSHLKKKDGSRKPCLLSIGKINIEHFKKFCNSNIVIVHDISETILFEKVLKKEIAEKTYRLQLEREKLDQIIKMNPDGIIAISNEKKVVLSNKRAHEQYYRLYGENFEPNKRIRDYPNNKYWNSIRMLFSDKIEESLTVEENDKYLEVHSARVNGKNNFKTDINMIMTIHDITSEVNFTNKQKKFITSLSHEFRTPVTIISSSISLLTDPKYSEKLSNEKREVLMNNLFNNAQRMTNLIEDMFLSRSYYLEEKIVLNKTEYSIKNLLNNVIDNIQRDNDFSRENYQISLKITNNTKQDDLKLFGDVKRIKQVFHEIIENAIRYRKPGNPVQIDITVKAPYEDKKYNPRQKKGVLVQIRDNSRGIKEEDLPHIFDYLFRSDEARDVSGVGLGLYFAKQILKHHRGSIFVQSTYGKGSVFFVFLPKK